MYVVVTCESQVVMYVVAALQSIHVGGVVSAACDSYTEELGSTESVHVTLHNAVLHDVHS